MKPFATVLIALCAAGCAGDPVPPGQENAIFPDLPAPQGFTYVNGYGHTQTAFRNYTQTYKGKGRVDATVKWYKEAFASNEWSLASETSGERASLTFVKKAEQALVVISDDREGLTILVKVNKRP